MALGLDPRFDLSHAYWLIAGIAGGSPDTTSLASAVWAYGLTKNVPLKDSELLQEIRGHFNGAVAHDPPRVLLGDEVSSSAYWHAKLRDQWAQQWMSYFTNGQGRFATTAMEDTGTLQSLLLLDHAGLVDRQRILALKAVSNFDQQPNGLDAASSLASQHTGRYGAFLPPLDSAYTVGTSSPQS